MFCLIKYYRYIQSIILILFCINLPAQKNSIPNNFHSIDSIETVINFNRIHIGNNTDKALEFCNNYYRYFFPHSTFSIHFTNQSIAATHYYFKHYYKGEKVYRSFVKINIDNNGYCISNAHLPFKNFNTSNNEFPPQSIADKYIHNNAYKNNIEKVWFYNGNELIPAWHIENIVSVENNYEIIVNENGILYYRDLNAYHKTVASNGDSTVSMLIFNPDPLTRAGVYYGAPYIDNNDNDVAELNAQRVQVYFPAYFDNGTFRLQSNYVLITEFSTPSTSPASSSSPSFHYTRAQNEFEDVNAFYHLNNYKNYLNYLGFTNLVNYQINVDAHGFNGADQSAFTPGFSPPRLTFGEGGVDDAEDADVLVHEYAHAISHSAAPNTNVGAQRQALDEGFGDYIAASYSYASNPFRHNDIFTWDGHNQFWSGRTSASTKIYPTNLTGSIHANGEIWSSVLMQIHNAIGREKTDSILLQSMYSYTANMTMPQAAQLFIQADSLLFNGANYPIICNYFQQRGLVSSCVMSVKEESNKTPLYQIYNSFSFQKGSSNAFIYNEKQELLNIKIIDIAGKEYANFASNQSIIEFNPQHFSKGIYIVIISNTHQQIQHKLLR
jgi:zinc metalloprotease ZmpB